MPALRTPARHAVALALTLGLLAGALAPASASGESPDDGPPEEAASVLDASRIKELRERADRAPIAPDASAPMDQGTGGEPRKEAVLDDAKAMPDISSTIPPQRQSTPGDEQPGSREELTDLRSEYAKFFREPDGSHAARFYSRPVHFIAEGGSWEEIDPTLVPAASPAYLFRNAAGAVSIEFGPAALGPAMVRVRKDGKTMRFGPEDVNPLSAPVVEGSRITYPAAYPGVDLVYEVRYDHLKEFLVLHGPPVEPPSFRFPLDLSGLTPEVDEEGTIRFLDSTGEPSLAIPPGWMEDSAQDPAWSSAVDISLDTSGLEPAVVIAPDMQWLLDPARTYPVSVDPSVVFSSTAVAEDTFVQSDDDGPFNLLNKLHVGRHNTMNRKWRSLIKFPGIEQGFVGTEITGATLNLWLREVHSIAEKTLYVEQSASHWINNQVTWPGPSGTGTSSSAAVGGPGTWVTWDVTQHVSNWVYTPQGNHGFRILASDESDTASKKWFGSSNAEAAQHPYLEVFYNTRPGQSTPLAPWDGSFAPERRPVLTATFDDPDGDWGYGVFEIRRAADGAFIASGDGSSTPSGGDTSWQVPVNSLQPGVTYRWRVTPWDGQHYGDPSGWSYYTPSDLRIGQPTNGAEVSGTIAVGAVSPGGHGGKILEVEFWRRSMGRDVLIGKDQDGSDGWGVTLDSRTLTDGRADLYLAYVDGTGGYYCCSPGTGIMVTVDNAAAGPEPWEATAEAPGLARKESSEAFVVLGSGTLGVGARDADVPRQAFSATFERNYSSTSGSSGILGRGWRTNLEDGISRAVGGAAIHVDGLGREHRYAPIVEPGLSAEYWSNMDLAGEPTLSRIDPSLSFNWGQGAPDPALPADGYSARWAGFVEVPNGGTWTFYALSDDGVRLLVDGQSVIEDWTGHGPAEFAGSIDLNAGRHEVVIEYFEWSAHSEISLSYEGPAVPKQAIPASALSHATGAFQPPAGVGERLAEAGSGQLVLTDEEGVEIVYDPGGLRDSVRDPNGNEIVYVYTQEGRPVYVCINQVTCDGQTAEVALEYEPATGGALQVSDIGGHLWTYDLDDDGGLASVEDPAGWTTTFLYDDQHRLQSVTHPQLPQETTLAPMAVVTYDEQERVASVSDPVATEVATEHVPPGPPTTFAYGEAAPGSVTVRSPEANATQLPGPGQIHELGSAGELLAHVDEVGNRTDYEYDGDLNLTKEIDPLRNETVYTYDGDGNLKSVTDPEGKTMTFAYFSDGSVKSETDPLGNTTGYTYDDNGNVETITDPENNTTRFEYFPDGSLKKETDKLLNETHYTYAGDGNLATITDAEGNKTEFLYYADGSLQAEIDPLGNITDYAYDGNGNLETVTDPEGNITMFDHFPDGSLKKETDPLLNQTTYTYDASGNLETVADDVTETEQNVTTFSYDWSGALVAEEDPEQNVFQYAYRPNGDLWKEIDPLGNEVEYGYRADGLVETIQEPGLTAPARFTYDDVGNLIEEVDPEGNIWQYEYLPTGDLAKEVDPQSNVIEYAYDGNGEPSCVKDAEGTLAKYQYNDVGDLKKEIEPTDHAGAHSYDAEGRLQCVENPSGEVTEFFYDGVGNLKREVDPEGNLWQYEYLPTGDLAKETDPEGNVTEYAYDGDGELSCVKDAGGHIEKYEYTDAGDLEKEIDPTDHTAAHSYDADGRLQCVENPPGDVFSYEYYKNGDLKKEIDPLGEIIEYQYDGTGLVTKVTEPGDVVTDISYDALGQLDQVQDPKGITDVEIDPLGNLESVTDPGGLTSSWTYDETGLLETEVAPAGNLPEADPGPHTTTFGHDDAGNMTSISDPSGRTVAFEPDAVGNVQTITDRSGAVTEIDYDTQGRERERRSPGTVTERAAGVVSPADPFDDAILPTSPTGSIRASLDWKPLPSTISKTKSGSLAEEATAQLPISAHGQTVIEASLGWDKGTKDLEVPGGRSSILNGGTNTRSFTPSADDSPIRGTLTWDPTTKYEPHRDETVSALATRSYWFTATADGWIDADVSWSGGLTTNLDLELYRLHDDGTEESLAETHDLAKNPESVSADGPAGDYRVDVINMSASSVTFTLEMWYAVYADLDLELREGGPSGTEVAASTSTGGAQPEEISYGSPIAGTEYTFRVVANEEPGVGNTWYTLDIAYPVSAYADLSLNLLDSEGAIVETASDASGSLAISFQAETGGEYVLEVVNESSDTDVPSYGLDALATLVVPGSHAGSIDEGASTSHPLEADGGGAVRASLAWEKGTRVKHEQKTGTVWSGTPRTHSIVTDATDAPIEASLSWQAATRFETHDDESIGALATRSYSFTAEAAGSFVTSAGWTDGLGRNLDLELYRIHDDGTEQEIAESRELTENPEEISTAVAAGDYHLDVINMGPSSHTFDLALDIPAYADLDLELSKGGSFVTDSAAPGTAQPEEISYQHSETGTYTFKIISTDPDVSATSYTLEIDYPVQAYADLALNLLAPDGSTAAGATGDEGELSLAHTADPPGGAYTVEIVNNTEGVEVPAYTLDTLAPTSGRYADLDLALLDATNTVVAEADDHAARPEVLTYEAPAEGQYKLRVTTKDHPAEWEAHATLPGTQVETITYDGAGRVTAITDGLGTTTIVPDGNGLPVHVELPDGATYDFGYDGLGQVTSIVDPTGEQTLRYEEPGELDHVIDQRDVRTDYEFDAAHHEVGVTRPTTDVDFGRDGLGRLDEVVEGQEVTGIDYGDQVYPTVLTHASGVQDEIEFDGLGRVDLLTLRPQPTAVPSLVLDYVYDHPNGHLTEVVDVTDPAASVTRAAYTYDGDDRLAGETLLVGGDTRALSYGYDAVANRTRVTSSTEGTTTFAYDGSGRLESLTGPSGSITTFHHDAAGNLEARVGPEGTTAYTFGPDGHLAEVALPDGMAVAFVHDAAGLRTEKSVDGTATEYSWEQGRLASTTTGTQTASFTYDDAAVPLTITTGGETYAYRYDDRGSVIELTDTSTGEAAATYTYDAWGRILDASGPEGLLGANPFAYLGAHGALWDPETATYEMGARTYDPALAAFLSPDPEGATPEISPYAYTEANPVGFIDPTGLTHDEASRFSSYRPSSSSSSSRSSSRSSSSYRPPSSYSSYTSRTSSSASRASSYSSRSRASSSYSSRSSLYVRRDPPIRTYARPSRPRASYTAVRRDPPTRFSRPTPGRPSAYARGAARAMLRKATSSIGTGSAKVGGVLWRNKWDILLTGAMFIPGGAFIRGAAWAARGLAAVRGTRAAGLVARTARAVGVGKLLARGRGLGSRVLGGARSVGRRLGSEVGAVDPSRFRSSVRRLFRRSAKGPGWRPFTGRGIGIRNIRIGIHRPHAPMPKLKGGILRRVKWKAKHHRFRWHGHVQMGKGRRRTL